MAGVDIGKLLSGVVKPRDPQETLSTPLLVLSQLVTAPSAPASRAAGCRAATLCGGP